MALPPAPSQLSPPILASLAVLVIYALTLTLHAALPGRLVVGYVCDNSGTPLRYKLNGILVFVAITGGFQLLLTLSQRALLFDQYGFVVATAFCLGMAASVYFYALHSGVTFVEPYRRCAMRNQYP